MSPVTRLIALFGCVILLVTACDPLGRYSATCVRPVGGRNILPFTSPMQPEHMALSPDGSRLAMTYAAPQVPKFGLFDLKEGTYREWQYSAIIPFPRRGEGVFAGLVWSANGDRVYALTDWTIHTLAIDRAAEQVAAPCSFCRSFDLSPSGTLAIVGALSGAAIDSRSVSALRSITDFAVFWSHPMEVAVGTTWSPDGRKLAVEEVFAGSRGDTKLRLRVFSHPEGTELPSTTEVERTLKPTWYNNDELVIVEPTTGRILRWNPMTGISATIATIGPEYKIPGGLREAMTRESSEWIVVVGGNGVYVVDRSCVKP